MSELAFQPSIRPGIYLQSPENSMNPYPAYAMMREHYPVCQLEPHGAWAVSRYKDVQYVLTTPEIFSSSACNALYDAEWFKEEFRNPRLIVAQDPPQHGLYHGLVNKAFVSRVINNLTPMVRAMAHMLFRQFNGRRSVDFMNQFAYPYTGKIVRRLVGIDDKQTLAEPRLWVELEEAGSPLRPDDSYIKLFESTVEKQNSYFIQTIEARRLRPQDDITLALIAAKVNGKPLSNKELCSIMGLLVVAGFVTTVQMLNHAIIQLARRPTLMAALAADLTRVPAFIEELLRHSSAVQAVYRLTTREVTVAGVDIPANALVMPLLGSANRDANVFDQPDEFQLERQNRKRHLSFGYGPHVCIGAALARLELTIALEVLLSTYSNIDIPPNDQLDWRDSVYIHGLSSLPVSFS